MEVVLKVFCGDEDFLVEKAASDFLASWKQAQNGQVDEEVLEAAVGNSEQLESCLRQFYLAACSLPLWGQAKCLRLKGINFMADRPTFRSESARKQLALWLEFLESRLKKGVAGSPLCFLFTCYPIDRRRGEYRFFKAQKVLTDLGSSHKMDEKTLREEAEALGMKLEGAAAEALLNRIGHVPRVAHMELEKLSTYLQAGETLRKSTVLKLVPPFGSVDFFEAVEAFFNFDLPWALEALSRQFFNDRYAGRPVLAALQNRLRLMIQTRAALDAESVQGSGGQPFPPPRFQGLFGEANAKSSFNLFTQNSWYLSHKIVPTAKLRVLKKWVDYQLACARAFEKMLADPDGHGEVLQQLFIQCLSQQD